jgi:O-antigen/teichoic acid export membrane protein
LSLAAKAYSLFRRDILLFVTNTITGIVVARQLGPTALGLWVILQMLVGYAEAFGRIKFDAAAVYMLGRKKYEIRDVVFTLNTLAVVTSALVVGLILWRFEWVYQALFANSDHDVRVYMGLVLVQVPLQFVSMNYAYLYIHREDVATYNAMVVIRSLMSSVLAIILLVTTDMGLLAVVLSTIVSVFAGLLYGIVRFGPVQGTRPLLKIALIRDLFSYASRLYATGVIGQLNAYMTRLVLALYLVPAQVAYFAMAQNFGQLLNKVPDALNTILFPRLSKIDSESESAQLAAAAFRVVLVILTALGICAFFLLGPLVTLLYGAAFVAVIEPFRIILPGLILSGATTVLDQFFSGIGKPGISGKIAVAPLVIQTLGATLLVPSLGLLGGALALLASLLSLAAIQLAVFMRLSGCTIKSNLLIRSEDIATVARFLKTAGRRLYSH